MGTVTISHPSDWQLGINVYMKNLVFCSFLTILICTVVQTGYAADNCDHLGEAIVVKVYKHESGVRPTAQPSIRVELLDDFCGFKRATEQDIVLLFSVDTSVVDLNPGKVIGLKYSSFCPLGGNNTKDGKFVPLKKLKKKNSSKAIGAFRQLDSESKLNKKWGRSPFLTPPTGSLAINVYMKSLAFCSRSK